MLSSGPVKMQEGRAGVYQQSGIKERAPDAKVNFAFKP